jgi:hypothetical protein
MCHHLALGDENKISKCARCIGVGAKMAQSRQIFREKICELARFWTLNRIPKYLSGSSLTCSQICVIPLMDDRHLPHKIENKIKIKMCDQLWLAASLPVKRASFLVPPCFSNPFRILSAHWFALCAALMRSWKACTVFIVVKYGDKVY